MAHLRYILIFIILQALCTYGQASGQDLVVVVNINNPTSIMTKSEVIDLFMGRYIAFPDGQKANPVELIGDADTKKSFYQDLVGMSLARVNAYWSRVKFTGRIKPSKKLSSTGNITGMLATSPLSISYMLRKHVTKDLKVVYAFNE
jgi:hypothetical protein